MRILSILFLTVCALRAAEAQDAIARPGPEFGREWKTQPLGVGPTMAVAVAGWHLVRQHGQGLERVTTYSIAGREELLPTIR